MAVLKLTKSTVDRITPDPEGKQIIHFDTTLKGFGIVVNQNSKTYITQRDVRGKTIKVTIGRHGVLTTTQARKLAQQLLAQMAAGENPNKKARIEKAKSVTLREALELYLSSPKPRSQKTLTGYRWSMEKYLSDWLDRPLREITRSDLYSRHRMIGKEHGTYSANGTVRVFRAIYNRALKLHEDLPANPSIAVEFFLEAPRQAAIPFDKLADWYEEVMNIENQIRRDFLRFVLFTGLRRESAASANWEHIDFDEETMFIPEPKGGTKRAFTLPLSEFILTILSERKANNEGFFPGSPFVFPSQSRTGYISEPKERLSIPFTVHGLRHTYISAAQAISVPLYDIKLLTNHSLPKGDVTAGYINPSIDSLRKQQTRISEFILKSIGLSYKKRALKN